MATSRAVAEDAVEIIDIEWEPMAAVSAGRESLSDPHSLVHAGDVDNLAFEARIGDGDTSAPAAIEVSAEFRFGRHTGVPLETRAAIADWNPGDETLTVTRIRRRGSSRTFTAGIWASTNTGSGSCVRMSAAAR